MPNMITATELARHTRTVLDRVLSCREVISVERNRRVIAQIVPVARSMSAREVLSGLHATLSADDGRRWLRDSRAGFDEDVRDPWA